MSEKIYVTHTCKTCGCAFSDIDELDVYVEPPDYKNCPECIKRGHKNTRQAREEYKPVARTMEYIYKWQQKSKNIPKKDADFVYEKCIQMIKEYKQFGKKINTISIFKQAIEILGYYKLEENQKKEELNKKEPSIA